MNLFKQFMDQIIPEALERNIRVRVLVSDPRPFPSFVVSAIQDIEKKTLECTGFMLNLCVSYGARDELVRACQSIASQVVNGSISTEEINEQLLSKQLLTRYGIKGTTTT